MRRIRVAQIGLNRYSHSHEIFYTMKMHPEVFELVGYAIVEDERVTCAGKLKELDGYPELTLDEILNDPTIEAVTIETDEIHLTKYALMAAMHGKHIHMEKPGSQSLEDFEALIDVMRKSSKVFHTGYMYRYNPYISDAIKRAKDGELGEIFAVEAHMSRTDEDKTREWLSAFKGGMMHYLGCHLIDLVLQVMGLPANVIALNRATGYSDVHSEDYGLALLEYPSGFSIVRTAATEIGGFDRRQLVIMGRNGTIEIKPLECDPTPLEDKKTRFSMHTQKREVKRLKNGVTDTINSKSEMFDRYEAMLLAFASMVRGERENPYTLDYELDLYKIILKCCGI